MRNNNFPEFSHHRFNCHYVLPLQQCIRPKMCRPLQLLLHRDDQLQHATANRAHACLEHDTDSLPKNNTKRWTEFVNVTLDGCLSKVPFRPISVYGVVRVVRGCGYLTDDRDDKACMKRSGTHDVQALYCACTSDLCNTSNQLFHKQQITIFAAIALPLIYFVNQRLSRQL